jgi:hypothetical protein
MLHWVSLTSAFSAVKPACRSLSSSYLLHSAFQGSCLQTSASDSPNLCCYRPPTRSPPRTKTVPTSPSTQAQCTTSKLFVILAHTPWSVSLPNVVAVAPSPSPPPNRCPTLHLTENPPLPSAREDPLRLPHHICASFVVENTANECIVEASLQTRVAR